MHRLDGWQGRVLVCAVVVAVLALVFGPGMSAWGTAYVGADDVDTWGTQWFYWVIGRRILEGEPVAHTGLLFHPWGKDVYLHTGGNVLDAALALPFRFLLGPQLGYNVFVLAVLLANGLGAAALCRELGAPRLGAGLLGAMVVVDPYTLGELEGGRPTQAVLIFVFLFWRDWLRLARGGSWGVALRAGLWLGLTGLCYWFYAIFGVMAAVLTAPVLVLGQPRMVPLFGRMVLAGLVSATVALPLAWPMLQALGAQEVPGMLALDQLTATPPSLVTREGWDVGLHILEPASRRIGFLFGDGEVLRFVADHRAMSTPLLVAAVLGLILQRDRRSVAVGCVLVLGLLLATGPQLGSDGPVDVLYIGLTEVIGPLRRLWWPSRALVLVVVAGVAGAALLLARLDKRPGVAALVAGLLVASGAAELHVSGPVPLSMASAEVPDVYRCLASAESGALIELPYGGKPARLHYQAVHGQPLFGGMLEDNPVFAPSDHVALREDNTWLLALFAAVEPRELGGRGASEARLETDRAALGELGFQYVLVDHQEVRARLEGAGNTTGARRHERVVRVRMSRLLGAAVYDDGTHALYLPWGGSLSCDEEGATSR